MLLLYMFCNRPKRGRDSVPSEEGLSKKKKAKVVDNNDTMQSDDISTTK